MLTKLNDGQRAAHPDSDGQQRRDTGSDERQAISSVLHIDQRLPNGLGTVLGCEIHVNQSAKAGSESVRGAKGGRCRKSQNWRGRLPHFFAGPGRRALRHLSRKESN